ncbi:hypothetical protein [Pseudanabaena sp. PCC 6802]|uniref:hypothetical protein n=1 Tax=Pseudanabaena sp. PCC 6802 TaxID=118173 RepID=UPI00034CFD24|nr:hypothetical protein [Pseudanabaena sp. PCC 6802]
MNLNLMLLAIATAATAVTVAIHPVPVVQANSNRIAQTYPALKGIQLTSAQQEKIQQIRQNAIVQLSNILTPDQKTTVLNAIGNNEDLRTAIGELNLSSDQKSQIGPILRSTYQQIANELTPTQRKQMQQNVRALIMGRFR